MRWEKLGLIFRPDGSSEWMRSHAAVPCAEQVSGDLYRIYFSSRDSANRSHVGYVELDITRPTTILGVSEAPVLSPGRLGAFDDSGTMLSWIARADGVELAYYVGWNLGVTVPFRNAIGLAIKEGTTFRRYAPGPIVDRSPQEPYFTASCCVLRDGSAWKMWYLSATGWELVDGRPRHAYHIKYAESADGISWHRSGHTCIDFRSEEEYAISRPCVIRGRAGFKMWYSYRGSSYRIGYAESQDGLNWVRKDDEVGIDVSPTGWDSEMIEYPFVFDSGDARYMLYNGNGYGLSGFGLARLVSG